MTNPPLCARAGCGWPESDVWHDANELHKGEPFHAFVAAPVEADTRPEPTKYGILSTEKDGDLTITLVRATPVWRGAVRPDAGEREELELLRRPQTATTGINAMAGKWKSGLSGQELYEATADAGEAPRCPTCKSPASRDGISWRCWNDDCDFDDPIAPARSGDGDAEAPLTEPPPHERHRAANRVVVLVSLPPCSGATNAVWVTETQKRRRRDSQKIAPSRITRPCRTASGPIRCWSVRVRGCWRRMPTD